MLILPEDQRILLGELVVDDHKQPLGVEGGPAEEEREDYSSWREKEESILLISCNLIFLTKSCIHKLKPSVNMTFILSFL